MKHSMFKYGNKLLYENLLFKSHESPEKYEFWVKKNHAHAVNYNGCIELLLLFLLYS